MRRIIDINCVYCRILKETVSICFSFPLYPPFADKIVVLEDGEAVAVGSHKELLGSCDIYREIHESQFGGGEQVG